MLNTSMFMYLYIHVDIESATVRATNLAEKFDRAKKLVAVSKGRRFVEGLRSRKEKDTVWTKFVSFSSSRHVRASGLI